MKAKSLIKKTTVISPPGAAIRIESVELTDEGKRLLTIPAGSMDKFAINKDNKNPKKDKLKQKISKLQNELWEIEKKERDEEKSKIKLLPDSVEIPKKEFGDFSVELKGVPPMVFVSDHFLDEHLIPRIGTSKFPNYEIKPHKMGAYSVIFPVITDIICPICKKGNLVADSPEARFSGGMNPFSSKQHVGDDYKCRCNHCDAYFSGDKTWMWID
jgi:hypothetical protein